MGRKKPWGRPSVLSIVPQRFFNRFRSNLPMRSVPDGLAVSQDDYLRRFVFNTGAYADLAGKIAGVLDLDQGDLSLKILHLPVCAGTYRTGCAVLENDHRFLIRAIHQFIQRGGGDYSFEMIFHVYKSVKLKSLPIIDISLTVGR